MESNLNQFFDRVRRRILAIINPIHTPPPTHVKIKAPIGSQEGISMWPSLSTAETLYDFANIGLIFAAVIGVSSTIFVVWMGNVKEKYSKLEIATLTNSSAQANREAAIANLELAKLKQPRALSEEQRSRISKAIEKFARLRFDMSVIPGDPEAISLLLQIGQTLRNAGWDWIEFNHPNGPYMQVFRVPNAPDIGAIGGIGVLIVFHSDHSTLFSEAANVLSDALNAEQILSGVDSADPISGIPNHDTMHITIGKKPL
jgi:hypothetical protein